MFGRVAGTRPNISESHSEISTRVPFCIGRAGLREESTAAVERLEVTRLQVQHLTAAHLLQNKTTPRGNQKRARAQQALVRPNLWVKWEVSGLGSNETVFAYSTNGTSQGGLSWLVYWIFTHS